jgi:hypothetical protein
MKRSTWQQMLVDEHPKLFVRSFRNVPFSPGYPNCSDGWQDIVARLVTRVSRAAHGYSVHFAQIREQYGVLRVHWSTRAELPRGLELGIEEAVALAEARSSCTCTRCGAAGRLFSHGTRLLTVCPKHAEGIPVPVARGHQDGVHAVRVAVSGTTMIVCRRYDREADAFVECSPPS